MKRIITCALLQAVALHQLRLSGVQQHKTDPLDGIKDLAIRSYSSGPPDHGQNFRNALEIVGIDASSSGIISVTLRNSSGEPTSLPDSADGKDILEHCPTRKLVRLTVAELSTNKNLTRSFTFFRCQDRGRGIILEADQTIRIDVPLPTDQRDDYVEVSMDRATYVVRENSGSIDVTGIMDVRALIPKSDSRDIRR